MAGAPLCSGATRFGRTLLGARPRGGAAGASHAGAARERANDAGATETGIARPEPFHRKRTLPHAGEPGGADPAEPSRAGAPALADGAGEPGERRRGNCAAVFRSERARAGGDRKFAGGGRSGTGGRRVSGGAGDTGGGAARGESGGFRLDGGVADRRAGGATARGARSGGPRDTHPVSGGPSGGSPTAPGSAVGGNAGGLGPRPEVSI